MHCATTRAHSRSHTRDSAVPIYHLFTNDRHLTKSLSCHDFFMRYRSKTTLGQQPNTKQSAIYKTKCDVLNCLLYTRAPHPHMHIQHMQNQHTHIFPPHVCWRLCLQNLLQKAEQRVKNTCAETFHVWMDLALYTHLYQALVPLVDSGSKGGGFIGTTSSSRSRSNSGSTTSSACLLRT